MKSCSRADFQQGGSESGIPCYFKGYTVRLLVVHEENYVCQLCNGKCQTNIQQFGSCRAKQKQTDPSEIST
jgi:hypothetical protein